MRSKKVALATVIHVSDRLLSRILEFAGALIVARVLAPEAFGVVMIGVSALTMARGLTEFPVANALIQKKKVDEYDYATVFALTNARGILIALGLFAVAGILAKTYNEPTLVPIIYCLAIAPLATGFASPLMAAHLRDMNFIPLAISSLIGRVVAFIATVTIILTTGSYWALVAGLVLGPVTTTILTYIIAPSPIKLSLKHGKEFFAFSSWMSLASGALIAYTDGVKFVIGYFVSAAALGIYSVGYSVARTGVWALAGPTIQTFFIGFTEIQDDPEGLKKSYLKSQEMLTAIFFPIGIGLAIIATPLVALMLGPEWKETAMVIAWLAPGMAYMVVSSPAQAMSMAVNKTKSMFFRNLWVAIISLPILVVATMKYGLLGAVVARLIGAIINTFAGFLLVQQIIQVPFHQQLKCGWRSIISGGIMMLVDYMFIKKHFQFEALEPLQIIPLMLLYILLNAAVFLCANYLLWLASGKPPGAEMSIMKTLKKLFTKARILVN